MATFSRLLCPIDFSDTSARALRYADEISSWYGASLTVQHVFLPLFVSVPGLPEVAEPLPEVEAARLSAETTAFAARAGARSPAPRVVVDAGRPADEILARASREKPDLVVMGTHGEGGFRHLVLGSVTEKVLRQLPCPVLTVPPHVHGTSMPFRRIICAVDFSEWSLAALDLAATLAQPNGATLVAVHAIEWPWHEPPAPAFDDLPKPQAEALKEYRRYVTDRAHHRLSASVSDVVGDRCEVVTEVVHGKPHVELLRSAQSHGADLVALGVHGRSAIDVAVFGSTTNQVVRHAECPVLTVRR